MSERWWRRRRRSDFGFEDFFEEADMMENRLMTRFDELLETIRKRTRRVEITCIDPEILVKPQHWISNQRGV